MSKEKETLLFHDHSLYPRHPTETKEYYRKWSDTYERDLITIRYNGHNLVVKHFMELGLVSKTARILDIASGTGIVGSLLQQNGFTNIDGLDATQEMLEIAKQKNCYKNFINSFVSKDIRLPIEDQSYDAIVMAGCICPGHISYESFPQIIRVIKKGGIICWSMALPEEYKDRDQLFTDNNFKEYIELLCVQNKWKYISGYPKRVDNYSRGNDGWVYVMEVL